jgi:uncharacterized membrane protein
MGQGGTRRVSEAPVTTPVGDRTSDARWKWGIFYVNPDDPAIFVEKRFGIGYTPNLANRWSWVILGMVVVVPLAIALVATRTR